MNREDILKAAQMNEDVNDEAERDVTRKALLNATAFGVMLLLVMCLLEGIIFKKIDFGKPALLFSLSAYSSIYEGRRLQNKKTLVAGIIEAVVATLLLILYIGALLI